MLKSLVALLVIGALATTTPAPSYAGGAAKTAKKNIVQVARDAGTFNTLLAALKATDLIGTLSGQGQGPFTVFAPTDEAFAKLPAGTLESLLADPAALKSILLYHVVPGAKSAGDVVASSSLETVNGKSLAISTVGGVKIDAANVTATDIVARNGVIHVIDTVLIPR